MSLFSRPQASHRFDPAEHRRDLGRRRRKIEAALFAARTALREARAEAEGLGPLTGARSLGGRVQALEVQVAAEIRTLYALGTSSARED